MKERDFTQGKILGPLLLFAGPLLISMFLQSLYGAVDLLIVGQYASSADVSAIATGSQIMTTITNFIVGLSMGTTVLIGQKIGMEDTRSAGKVFGTSICLFAGVALVLTAVILLNIDGLIKIMNVPSEAYAATRAYVKICSSGLVFIVGYNLIGSLFRGLGNSQMPLISIIIATLINIIGDLLLVVIFHLGAAGAAYATILAQTLSLLISFLIIKRQKLPFEVLKSDLQLNKKISTAILSLGIPISLSELLIGITQLVIMAIVNSGGVVFSAGVGVAQKVANFILMVPISFGQAITAFVAQNYGAGKLDRAEKALKTGVFVAFIFGALLAAVSWFKGDLLCGIFSKDKEVIASGWLYLKANALDCLVAPLMFGFAGFFNGCGETKFVMIENVIGGIAVRLPVSLLMTRMTPVSVFNVGLATPISTLVQNTLCIGYMFLFFRKKRQHVDNIAF